MYYQTARILINRNVIQIPKPHVLLAIINWQHFLQWNFLCSTLKLPTFNTEFWLELISHVYSRAFSTNNFLLILTWHVITYDLFFIIGSTAVGSSEGWGTLLQIPGFTSVFGRAADGESVDTVGVSITVTAVEGTTSITWGPHKNVAFTASTLQKIHLKNS